MTDPDVFRINFRCKTTYDIAVEECVTFFYSSRSAKPRNRPTFRQILMHLEIASPDWLTMSEPEFFQLQVSFATIK